MRRRNLFAVLVVLCIGVLTVSLSVSAMWYGEPEPQGMMLSGDYKYVISDNGAVVIGLTSSIEGELVISETIDGHLVTCLERGAFVDCGGKLTRVVIPETVTSIGDGAFWNCTSLKSIEVNEGNQSFASIDGVLFSKDKKSLLVYPAGKEESVYTVPESATTICASAFGGAEKLTSVIIPDSVTIIEEGAFRECENLTEMNSLGSITTIESSLFSGCYNLESVSIPVTVTSIGDGVFWNCNMLKAIEVSEGNSSFSSIDGVLFSEDRKSLLVYPVAKEGAGYTVPESVTTICDNAFEGAEKLTHVSISDKVTSIGDGAFSGCKSLTEIILPDSLTYIGKYAFNSGTYAPNSCLNLKTIYYTGSKDEWNNITINFEKDFSGEGNDALKKAAIHFDYKPISVKIDGKNVVFDQQPIIENGRTLVPIRGIFEALDATVGWDGTTQTVTAQRGDTSISLQIGSAKMYVNGEEKILDVPAKLVGGRTLVPARAVSEAFGCDVQWDAEHWSVRINSL